MCSTSLKIAHDYYGREAREADRSLQDRGAQILFEQCIRLDTTALFRQLEPYPLLFQFSHLIAFHKMDWRDALRWVTDHKGQILAYDRGEIDEHGKPKLMIIKDEDEQTGATTTSAN